MQKLFFTPNINTPIIAKENISRFLKMLCAWCVLLLFILTVSCGGKKGHLKVQKKIEITITGLDGNGIAEKKITDALIEVEGIKTISFNYLNNQVVVLFDTTAIKQTEIINIITKMDEGRHKVIEVKTNNEPIKEIIPTKPDSLEDIKDDVNNQYKNNG